MWLNEKGILAYFGDIADNVRSQENYDEKKFLQLKNKIEKKISQKLGTLFFLKQTHSADVFVLDNLEKMKTPIDIFSYEGDAIITQEKNIGIGVVTADCLPVFLIDEKNNAIGVVHAGWKGLHVNIISATIQKMHDNFNSDISTLKIFFGPSACVCCYEVQSDFLQYFDKKYFIARDGKTFFSARQKALDELAENHVKTAQIDTKNNICTICSENYCSVRRQGQNAGRQPSVITLL